MCCVMPPASRSATRVSRMASSSDVLPWSTWPMTVTTGARDCMSSAFDSSPCADTSSSSKLRISISAPNSRAMSFAVSMSSVLLMVIIMRFINSLASTSFTRTSSLSARSFTVMPSASVIVRVIGGRPPAPSASPGPTGARASSAPAVDQAAAGPSAGADRTAAALRVPGRACLAVPAAPAAYERAGLEAGAVRPAFPASSDAAVAGSRDAVRRCQDATHRACRRGCRRTRGCRRLRGGRLDDARLGDLQALAGASGRAGCGIFPGSSMRSRIVGGTNRPAADGGGVGAGVSGLRFSSGAGAGSSIACGATGGGSSIAVALRDHPGRLRDDNRWFCGAGS